MNEKEWILKWTEGLTPGAGVKTGVGDDCAVLDAGNPKEDLLFKTDAVAAGVHFHMDAPPDKIGWKAVCRCLSDFAAMGGTPTSCLATLGLSRGLEPEFLQELYRGIREASARYEVDIVGGETVTQDGPLFISIAMIGRVPKGKAILRAGARTGDAVFVSGELGGSIQGRHLTFEPRIAQGQWLNEKFDVHAMIDLSDGLATDLRHLLDASGVGAELLSDAIPISREARLSARQESSSKSPLLMALTDGEDYELLFALPGAQAVSLLDSWKAAFPEVRLSCIGKILKAPGLHLMDRAGKQPLIAHGYDHFKQS